MRTGTKATHELVEALKNRLAEGLIALAREDETARDLCHRLIEERFEGTERELARSWFSSQTENQENARLLLRFPDNPQQTVVQNLETLGFRWQNQARGWIGQGNPQLIEEQFSVHGASVTRYSLSC